jgi:hypothetical protein
MRQEPAEPGTGNCCRNWIGADNVNDRAAGIARCAGELAGRIV